MNRIRKIAAFAILIATIASFELAFLPAQARASTASAVATETTTVTTSPAALVWVCPRTIRQGARGHTVTVLQKELHGRGYLPGWGIDGIFGPQTRRAVIAFQNAAKLKYIDGIVGPETWRALGKCRRAE